MNKYYCSKCKLILGKKEKCTDCKEKATILGREFVEVLGAR